MPLVAATAWGRWQVSSRAYVHVSLHDVALKTERQRWGDVLAADLVFRDAAGKALARARADPPYGTVSMLHPDVGDCRTEERRGGDAWRRCFDAQTRWVMMWADDVRDVSVSAGRCTIARVPVVVDEHKGAWWLWWVPLPHMDNSLYTTYWMSAWIDTAACQPVDPASLDVE